MKQPFDVAALMARMASLHDSHGPVDHPLPYVVILAAPISDNELETRWRDAQEWCRDHVNHSAGDQWSRRRDQRNGDLVFSFSDLTTGVTFTMRFQGLP
jgi:hypothetical protein